jgi:hypothetical protein
MSNKLKVLNLYKELLHVGKSYPDKPYNQVRSIINKSFVKNMKLSKETEIEEAIKKGEYIIKEIEALVYLKKYRSLKKSYYDE